MKKSRFGKPTRVSPHPEKLPPGPAPYSFTFDFTSAPDPLNPGGDGDDWLDVTYDGIGYEPYPTDLLTVDYNQTVGGRSGVAKYSHISGQEQRAPIWYASAPEAHEGQSWYKNLGRVNSFPVNYKEYSTWRLRTDFYISGVNPSANTYSAVRAGLGTFSQNNVELLSESSSEIVEDQWVTWDSGEQPVDPSKWIYSEGDWFRFYVSHRSGEDSNIFILDQSGGFFALDNFTISFTP